MRNWEGISAMSSATAQGDAYASNARFWIEGELRRRDGMSSFQTATGVVMADFRAADGTQYVVFVTSAGTVDAVIAS